MARTIRVYWPNQTSGWNNFNWVGGGIDRQSVVHIVASEGAMQSTIAGALVSRFRGAAVVGVRNIVPHDDMGGGGGVEFYLEVGWDSPLNIVTDITVLDPPEGVVAL